MKSCIVAIALSTVACGPNPSPQGVGGAGGDTNQGNAFCSGVPSPAQVLQAKCTSCHSDPPNSGAPFKLTTYADARDHAPAIAARIEAGSMPPPTANTPLSTEQKAALLSWVNAGAPGNECVSNKPGCPEDPNLCVGEQFLPCVPDAYILAYSPEDRAQKFVVRAGVSDHYDCFQFANPFYGTGRLITAEAPVIDNANVVHHWLLFGGTTGTDGQVNTGSCIDPQLGDTLLTGWAPGGTNQVYPSDVGVRISEFPILTLQTHYNNPSDIDLEDGSGIAFCSTSEAKPNVAGTVTLGTDLGIFIPPGSNDYAGGVSSCPNLFKGSNTGTATIVTSAPHMHQLGSGFTTEQLRDGERVGYVSNVPVGTWSFDRQTHYPHSEVSPGGSRILVEPGDVLKTTCYYTNPGTSAVGFGGKTTKEMCYDFLMVYPIDELRRGCGPLITFLP
jgi:hypothetical protein